MSPCLLRRSFAVATLLAASSIVLAHAVAAPVTDCNSDVYSSNSHPKGHSYGEWSASWWTWMMGLPLADHPATDTANFDITEGQTGDVWFLTAPFGTTTRTGTIPKGKYLFLGLLNVEGSSLEVDDSGNLMSTEAAQRAYAKEYADLIDPSSLFCTIDGDDVTGLGGFRCTSPQFSFTAPSPWLFGSTGGTGTSCADGYFLFLKKLKAGTHTIHYGGSFVFPDGSTASIDMTYVLTQQGGGKGGGGDD